MKELLLIDAHALIHRSYHALPPLTTPAGEPIGAIYGVARALLKALKTRRPDYVAAAFDRPEATFRKEMFEAYKAHRPKADDELVAQLVRARELFATFGIPCFEKPGFEGDDLIGTLAKRFGAEGLRVVILTGDMDALQLVDGDRTVVEAPVKGVGETKVYDADAVVEKYGVRPDQMVDYKGLVGDTSDNIPGVPGVGPKTAAVALAEFGTVERLFAEMPETHKLAKKFLPHRDVALLSKKLATIKTDVDVPAELPELAWNGVDAGKLSPYFEALGFNSMANALAAPAEKTAEPEAEIAENPALCAFDPDRAAEQKDCAKVAFDWKYLWKDLAAKGAEPEGKIFDIMVAAWLLDPEEKAPDLAELARGVAKIDVEKEPGRLAEAFAKIAAALDKRLAERGLAKIFEEIEMPLVPVLAAMETRGIAVDGAKLAALETDMRAETDAVAAKMFALAGETFNPNSPQQLGAVLYGKLGVGADAKKKKTATGQLKTDRDTLLELSDEHPLVPLVLEYRETFKALTGFVEPLRAASAADGRVHTTYLQTGTATGRLSSENPNMQNVPHDGKFARPIRAAFRASEGMSLVSIDWSQLELRLLAHVSRDPVLEEAFKNGDDIHAITAAKVFGVAPENVDAKLRRVGKTLNFGMIYGMGPRLFAKTAGVSQDEAKKFIADYFAAFPNVREWQEKTKDHAKTYGWVQNENGRKRWFKNGGAYGEFERAAMNMPLQGLGADIVKIAMIRAADLLAKEGGGALLLSIHDELLFEIENGRVAELAPKLKAVMESAWPLRVPLAAEMKRGADWGTMEHIKNHANGQ